MPDPSRVFSSALDALVDHGTITWAQQTAIAEALSSAVGQAGSGQREGQTQLQSEGSSSTGSAQTY